jgi:putative nucleotidyltransferase with HDIG domain
MMQDRNAALALLREYNSDEALLRHALAVEAVMRFRASRTGEDPEKWGVIGLLHDLDYQRFPKEHCSKTAEIMRSALWPEEYIRAILSHGYGMFTDVVPEHHMEKFLYAADELTGLVAATALVRPSRSLMDLEVKSVKKKWKDRTFAAGVDRSVIEKGAAMLSMETDELIGIVIQGMREAAADLGLAGN